MNVQIGVLNCQKCNQHLNGQKSLGLLFFGVLFMSLSLPFVIVFVFVFVFCHVFVIMFRGPRKVCTTSKGQTITLHVCLNTSLNLFKAGIIWGFFPNGGQD